MFHQPITINNLELSFAHKTCFENFNAQINYGDRIAIIGRNGSGKSSLIKILQTKMLATNGNVIKNADVIMGYVPQIINSHVTLSGGQRFNKSLSHALTLEPNILLLDEPTNHLDNRNRKSLMRMLKNYSGTLIVISHDPELLRNCTDILWHIDQGKINIFNGYYDDYMREIALTQTLIERELSQLEQRKKEIHSTLMKEQKRSAQSVSKGKKNLKQQKWPSIVAKSKAGTAQQTAGRKTSAIEHKKQHLDRQLQNLFIPETIMPKFSLTGYGMGDQAIVSITEGTVACDANVMASIISDINLSINAKDKIALIGDNGCGKSTLVKAIFGDSNIIKTGTWHCPHQDSIGYIDQHYNILSFQQTVIESLLNLVPTWSHAEIRSFLNDFLFRKNDEVNMIIDKLSGGEKARLCLAHIAAKPPKLLILDEITNNLDLETRGHVIDVLKNYPGAMLVISHDTTFLEQIDVIDAYKIQDHTMKLCKING